MLETTLIIATLLCGLVAGLLSGFAVVTMPGIRSLPDGEFIRAFQVMDRIIQNNQPLFMLAWIGSVVAVVASAAIGLAELDGVDLGLVLAAAVVYLIGVQAPTAVVNIPLNNALQEVDTGASDDRQLAAARERFERRWNTWNRIRSALATVTTALLAILLLRL